MVSVGHTDTSQLAGGRARAAAALLTWWRDAGADWPVAVAPQPWTTRRSPEVRPAPTAPAPSRVGPAPHVAPLRFAALADLVAHVAATSPGAPLADGNPDSGLMILGEAPSAEDLRTGRPFSGPAGALLDRMLAAIGLDRTHAYVTLLAPRLGVPGPPPVEAVAADLPLTLEHIRLVRPRRLLLLGNIPTQALTGEVTPISRMRGRFLDIRPAGAEVRALPTFNPAYLLRQPAAKRDAWHDLLLLKRELRA